MIPTICINCKFVKQIGEEAALGYYTLPASGCQSDHGGALWQTVGVQYILTRPDIRWNEVTGKTGNAFILFTLSSLWLALRNNSLFITAALTTCR